MLKRSTPVNVEGSRLKTGEPGATPTAQQSPRSVVLVIRGGVLAAVDAFRAIRTFGAGIESPTGLALAP